MGMVGSPKDDGQVFPQPLRLQGVVVGCWQAFRQRSQPMWRSSSVNKSGLKQGLGFPLMSLSLLAWCFVVLVSVAWTTIGCLGELGGVCGERGGSVMLYVADVCLCLCLCITPRHHGAPTVGFDHGDVVRALRESAQSRLGAGSGGGVVRIGETRTLGPSTVLDLVCGCVRGWVQAHMGRVALGGEPSTLTLSTHHLATAPRMVLYTLQSLVLVFRGI